MMQSHASTARLLGGWPILLRGFEVRTRQQAAATTDHLGIASRSRRLQLLTMMPKEEDPGLAAIQAIWDRRLPTHNVLTASDFGLSDYGSLSASVRYTKEYGASMSAACARKRLFHRAALRCFLAKSTADLLLRKTKLFKPSLPHRCIFRRA